MTVRDFVYRSMVHSQARNKAIEARPGVLLSWFVVCKDGDLIIVDGKIVRCNGVARLHNTKTDTIRYSDLDGSNKRSMFVREDFRVEKFNLIDDGDISRFLNGTQLTFIRDVEAAYREEVLLIKPTPAQRERNRRANETPEQADERRRKNRENMRRKRAGK